MPAFRSFSLSLSLTALLLGTLSAHAQQPYGFEFATDIPVLTGTTALPQPWAGGFNSASFSKIELNGDGVEDLYVHDHTSQRGLTFVAENGPSGWYWRHAPAYEDAFPVETALATLLRDYDGDGRKDYFAVIAPQYIELYRNVATPGGVGFEFQPVSFRLQQDNGAGSTRAVSTSSYGLLSIEDIDGDNKLDILDYAYGSDILSLYRNITPAGSPTPLYQEVQQWGGFVRCAGAGQACHAYAFAGTNCRPVHGANRDYSLLAADLDGDGDRDIVTGEQYCRDLALLQNQGTTQQPGFEHNGLFVPYPAGPPAASMVHTPAAFYEDVTFDGQPDLLVTPWLTGLENSPFPFAGDQYDTRASAWLYARTGPGLTAFGYQRDNFLQHEMVDVGNQAAPALGDLDGDGDLDLLVGNLADFVPPPPPLNVGYTSYRAQLRFYRNVGTLQNPIFQLEDEDFGQFSALNKRGLVPVLTDLDGNGTPDLVVRYNDDAIGHVSGTKALAYILNTAPAGQLATFPTASLRSFRFSSTATARSFRDAPAFYDVDGDGDRDMLLGTYQTGSVLQLVRNNGGSPDTGFAVVDRTFGMLPTTLTGISPAVADFDGNGQAEVLTVDDTGELRVWPGLLASPGVSTPAVSSLVRNDVTQVFGPARLGNRSVLTVGDLNADGFPEVLVGSAGGGLRLLRHQPTGSTGLSETAATRLGLEVFPNPASRQVTVRTSGEPVSVQLLDALGRVVLAGPARPAMEQTIAVDQLPAGFYLLRARTATGSAAVRRLAVTR